MTSPFSPSAWVSVNTTPIEGSTTVFPDQPGAEWPPALNAFPLPPAQVVPASKPLQQIDLVEAIMAADPDAMVVAGGFNAPVRVGTGRFAPENGLLILVGPKGVVLASKTADADVAPMRSAGVRVRILDQLITARHRAFTPNMVVAVDQPFPRNQLLLQGIGGILYYSGGQTL